MRSGTTRLPSLNDDEADFFAGEELFDRPRAVRGMRGPLRLRRDSRDDDAFAGGETIGFDDDRVSQSVERGDGSRRGSGGTKRAVGMPSSLQEVLCVNFAAFELGVALASVRRSRRPRGTELSTIPATRGASGPTTVRSASTDSAMRGNQRKSRRRENVATWRCLGCRARRRLDVLRDAQAPSERVLAAAAADHRIFIVKC